METFSTIAEAARVIGRTPDTLRRWERAGRISRVRRDQISGARIYSADDLQQLRQIVGRADSTSADQAVGAPT